MNFLQLCSLRPEYGVHTSSASYKNHCGHHIALHCLNKLKFYSTIGCDVLAVTDWCASFEFDVLYLNSGFRMNDKRTMKVVRKFPCCGRYKNAWRS